MFWEKTKNPSVKFFTLSKNALKLNKIKKESSDELNKINKLNKDYENRIKVLENKNNHLKKQHDEIISSNSWKITKP
jgi:hypothetical protein